MYRNRWSFKAFAGIVCGALQTMEVNLHESTCDQGSAQSEVVHSLKSSCHVDCTLPVLEANLLAEASEIHQQQVRYSI